MTLLTPEDVAEITHEIIQSYKQGLGDEEPLSWLQSEPHQRENSLQGVIYHLTNPDAGPEESHQRMVTNLQMDGWQYGPEKDEVNKLHPCLVPYHELPEDSRRLDHIFLGAVNALRPYTKSPSAPRDQISEKIQETEIVVFGKIEEMAQLAQIPHREHHVQLEARFKEKGKARVRKTTVGEKVSYELTIKDPVEGVSGANTEYTIPIDELFFEGFSRVATLKVIKTRYTVISKAVTFTIQQPGGPASVTLPSVKYEIDVYTGRDQNPSPWCKIDIEIDEIVAYIHRHYPNIKRSNVKIDLKNLPITITNAFVQQHATTQQREFVDTLFREAYAQSVG